MTNWKMVAINAGFGLLFALLALVSFAQSVLFLSIGHYAKGAAMAVLACVGTCMIAHITATTREWLRDDREFDAIMERISEDMLRKDWDAADRGLDDARAFVKTLNAKGPPWSRQ
jgi:hypothetical protein